MVTLLFFSEFIISSLFEREALIKIKQISCTSTNNVFSRIAICYDYKMFSISFIATGEMKKILYISVLQLITNFILSIILMNIYYMEVLP